MTDKEKEAVKFFYNLRATIDESIMLFDEDINVKCGKETIKQITTVLNLIQTQQAEIDSLKDFKEIAESKVTDLNPIGLARTNQLLSRQCHKLQEESEKKDKIIDLMAEWLDEDDTSFGYGNLKDVNTSEKIKQYFERKVENGN